MNQLHPRQDDSGGLASTRSGITMQDLLGKARHLANRHQPKVGGVLTPAAAHLHGRQPTPGTPRWPGPLIWWSCDSRPGTPER